MDPTPQNFSMTPRAIGTIREACKTWQARLGAAYLMPVIVWAHAFGHGDEFLGEGVFLAFYDDPSVVQPEWIETIDGLDFVFNLNPDDVHFFDDAILDHGDGGFFLTKKPSD